MTEAEAKNKAIQNIRNFSMETTPSVWPHVSKHDVWNGLIARVKDPTVIDQGPTPLCGPHSFLEAWATADPVGYADFGISLHKYGQGWVRRASGSARSGQQALLVTASQSLRHSTVPREPGHSMHPADWMMASSLRENLNVILSAHRTNVPLVGMLLDAIIPDLLFGLRGLTTPSQMVKMLKGAGFTTVTDQTHPFSATPLSSATVASNYLNTGWAVLLLIDADMLNKPNRLSTVSVGNHWIRLHEAIQVDPARPQYLQPFQISTWGKKTWVQLPKHEATPRPGAGLWVKVFESNYRGFIAARY